MMGDLAGRRVVVMATGDGAVRARQGLSDLLASYQVDSLMAIGIAGGLSTDLAVGDVLVARSITNGSGEVPPPDRRLLSAAEGLLAVKIGVVHSHSEIAVDPIAKERLWRAAGAIPNMVVDLESASYAREAASHGVPYLVLRAVSDSHDEALPLDFNRFRRPDGSADRGRITRHALLQPSIIPELMQLRERLRHCASRLATYVEQIVSD